MKGNILVLRLNIFIYYNIFLIVSVFSRKSYKCIIVLCFNIFLMYMLLVIYFIFLKFSVVL